MAIAFQFSLAGSLLVIGVVRQDEWCPFCRGPIFPYGKLSHSFASKVDTVDIAGFS